MGQPSRDPPRLSEMQEHLASHRAELEEMGVRYLAVFGSVVRDEAGPESDVDVLVELERPAGLFRQPALELLLQQLLGRHVDVVPSSSLRAELRTDITDNAVCHLGRATGAVPTGYAACR